MDNFVDSVDNIGTNHVNMWINLWKTSKFAVFLSFFTIFYMFLTEFSDKMTKIMAKLPFFCIIK